MLSLNLLILSTVESSSFVEGAANNDKSVASSVGGGLFSGFSKRSQRSKTPASTSASDTISSWGLSTRNLKNENQSILGSHPAYFRGHNDNDDDDDDREGQCHSNLSALAKSIPRDTRLPGQQQRRGFWR